MRKRGFRKSKSKLKVNMNLLVITIILLFFFGTAYSILNRDLLLEGTIKTSANNSSNPDDNEEIQKHNLDAEILNISTEGSEGNYRIYVTFKVTNNNKFDVNNWTAVLKIPNVQKAESWELQVYEVDKENEQITILSKEGNYTASIPAGKSTKPYQIVAECTSLDLDNISIYAYTNYDSFELKSFEYQKDNLLFTVDFAETSNFWGSGKYASDITITVKNTNITDTINLSSLDLLYKRPIESAENMQPVYPASITEKTLNKVSLSLTNTNLKPGESKQFGVKNIVTGTEKFRGISIENIIYSINGVSAKLLQTKETNNKIEKEVKSNIVSNKVEVKSNTVFNKVNENLTKDK